MRFGVDQLLNDKALEDLLKKRKFALCCNQASMTSNAAFAPYQIAQNFPHNLVAFFSPQHGLHGIKQDNMIESSDEFDEVAQVPVYSLYSDNRRPQSDQLDQLDLVLFDLQDVGCRIYTFITTLFYLMDACEEKGKEMWVLDRPNPLGRAIDGLALRTEAERSFVGHFVGMPLQHGMTVGELAKAYHDQQNFSFPLKIVKLEAYDAALKSSIVWDRNSHIWVSPSPNLPSLDAVAAYPGTVLIEGTEISEGRGTCLALQILGGPSFPTKEILQELDAKYLNYTAGFILREHHYEAKFHKFQDQHCRGLQWHLDPKNYHWSKSRPYLLMMLILKIYRKLRGEIIWKKDPYEYEFSRNAFDVVQSNTFARQWLEDAQSDIGDLEVEIEKDLKVWREICAPHFLYQK